jgi:hypothetical protein
MLAKVKGMSGLIVVQRRLGRSSLKETLGTFSHHLEPSGGAPRRRSKGSAPEKICTQFVLKKIKPPTSSGVFVIWWPKAEFFARRRSRTPPTIAPFFALAKTPPAAKKDFGREKSTQTLYDS